MVAVSLKKKTVERVDFMITKRVAREKIIIKAHFRDTVFEELGFERQIRPNQKLHYGVMDLSEGH